ncbi:putative translation initiation factor IF2/IF5, W2 domain, MIF4G-like domain superfamily [Helianthus annuus]|nr:putative translation initiation factor IF2/IF5, W2 domain, MIF4G-like domain superfamily [Helianthus annuus]
MALQNIGASNSDDAFYRYKMPKMITKIEGRGNGIKTNIVNMVDVAKALARPASYTTKYFGCELGAQSKFDEKTGVSLVNGSHDTAKLAGLLENFIKKYVQCYGCGNPETEILITKTQMVQLKCAACGFVSDVDMRDKLTSFILKNPPEQKKNSKDKKAMRRAEKERLKLLLLRAIEDFCGKSNPNAVKEVALVLKALYDVDILEEEYVVKWYEEGTSGGNKSSSIWKNAKPFVEWLQSAESESEEE